MKKKVLIVGILAALMLYIFTAVSTPDLTNELLEPVSVHTNYLMDNGIVYTVSSEIADHDTIVPPFVGKSVNGFKEALAFKESRGNYFVVNDFGYLGKYQFGASALRAVGVYNTKFFLNHPEMQEKAFIAYLERHKWILRKEIKKFEGKVINGVMITESGILAAAHLGGAGNVKKYLRSWGRYNFKDANGTSIWYYMKRFSGYDLSHIVPNRKAKI